MTNLHMPVIEPPTPLPANIVDYYAGIASETTVIAFPAPEHDAITIQIANPAHGKLYAMASGFVSFIPVGTPLHPFSAAPATKPTLLLEVDVIDINALRKHSSVPLVKYMLYEGVDPASVRASPELFDLVKKLSLEALQLAWPNSTTENNRDVLANNYLDQFLQGIRKVSVLPGTLLGQAEVVSLSSGPAVFTLRMAGPQKHDVSPVPLLKALPDIGAGGRKRYDQHPLALAVAGLPVPVNIYLKFEVWDLSAKVYRALPAGVRVVLMEKDAAIDDELATQLTDANGCVHFYYSTLADLKKLNTDDGTDSPGIFFQVQLEESQRQYAGHTLPAEWSTQGWKSANSRYSGYYAAYDGRAVGRDGDPAVFRIGLDLHLQLEYIDNNGNIRKSPPGVWIGLYLIPEIPLLSWRTNADGQVHAVLFDPIPSEFVFRVEFQIEDSGIKLPRADIVIDGWFTSTSDADKVSFPKYDHASLGSHANPVKLRCTVGQRNVALYILKLVREMSVFLFHITNGAWQGIPNFKIYLTGTGDRSYSANGAIHILPYSHWLRETIIHELGHEIMWKEAPILFNMYSDRPDFFRYEHYPNILYSPQMALSEGWAEFMADLFTSTTIPPHKFMEVYEPITKQHLPLVPHSGPLDGTGEAVEGAFANGLWTVFYLHVAPGEFPGPFVIESDNGDVAELNTTDWIKEADVHERFLKLIWRPLQTLKTIPNATTGHMIEAIRQQDETLWPTIRQELQQFNLLDDASP